MVQATTDKPPTPSRHPDRQWIPISVLAISLSMTLLASLYVGRFASEKDQQRFRVEVRDVESDIKERIEMYVTMLRSGAGLFAAQWPVSNQAFQAYADRLSLSTRYFGVQGIGFSRRVRPAEKDGFIQEMRQQGLTTTVGGRIGGQDAPFQIWPDGPRGEYYSIAYLAPLDRRNHAAIGYDMHTEPTRAAAMDLARDSGRAAASGKVTLVQEIDEQKQAGFLIYVPVYEGGKVPTTLDDRREKLLGHIYSPFRVNDVFSGVFRNDVSHPIDFDIYDGESATEESLLYRSPRDKSHADYRPRVARSVLRPGDRSWEGPPWTIILTSRPAFEAESSQAQVWFVAIGGALVSGVLFLMTRTQAKALAARRLAEEQRSHLLLREQEARQEAERASRLKDEFLATLSHELRTPLNAILGWAQLLRAGDLDQESVQQGLEAIERNSKAQSQLIEDLLDVSRIISGKLRLSREAVDLAVTVQAALDNLRSLAAGKEVRLEADLDRRIGTVDGDPTRLQQIVWNLVTNAIKFTPRGGTVRVRLRRELSGKEERQGDKETREQGEERRREEQRQEEENHGRDARATFDSALSTQHLALSTPPYAEIVISDSGQGISPEFLPHVFTRFRQADGSTTRRHGGLGLGLAIVQHLVELHGGTVTADSEGEGKGATFTVRLPLQQRPQESEAQAKPDDSPLRTQHSALHLTPLDGIHVLLVEDEPDARQLIKTLLEQAHAQVTAVGSASEAMGALRALGPQVLLSDIGMPDEDGYMLIRLVRALPAEQGGRIPAIALTAFARMEDHHRALLAGFQYHVAKPVDAVQITALIAKLAKAGTAAVKGTSLRVPSGA